MTIPRELRPELCRVVPTPDELRPILWSALSLARLLDNLPGLAADVHDAAHAVETFPIELRYELLRTLPKPKQLPEKFAALDLARRVNGLIDLAIVVHGQAAAAAPGPGPTPAEVSRDE